MSNAQVVAAVEQLLASSQLAQSTRTAFLAAVASDRTLQEANLQFRDDLKQTLRAMYSAQPTILAEFGLTVRKRAVLTPEELVARTAKADATRVARGTKGKRQLAAIHGNVTGVTITPIVDGAAPTAGPAPAAVAEPAKSEVVTK
jgi:hypothetical protein